MISPNASSNCSENLSANTAISSMLPNTTLDVSGGIGKSAALTAPDDPADMEVSAVETDECVWADDAV